MKYLFISVFAIFVISGSSCKKQEPEDFTPKFENEEYFWLKQTEKGIDNLYTAVESGFATKMKVLSDGTEEFRLVFYPTPMSFSSSFILQVRNPQLGDNPTGGIFLNFRDDVTQSSPIVQLFCEREECEGEVWLRFHNLGEEDGFVQAEFGGNIPVGDGSVSESFEGEFVVELGE